jgi:hypothetical protein
MKSLRAGFVIESRDAICEAVPDALWRSDIESNCFRGRLGNAEVQPLPTF